MNERINTYYRKGCGEKAKTVPRSKTSKPIVTPILETVPQFLNLLLPKGLLVHLHG
jgi:hypothetical protein